MSQQPEHLGHGAPQDDHNPLIVMPEDSGAFLRDMDLDVGDVDEAIGNGEQAARNTTTFAPVSGAGLRRWIQTVETLRERLVDSARWECRDLRNRPTARHLEGRYTFSIAGGDHRTGDPSPWARPRTARKKGEATRETVAANQRVLFELPANDPHTPVSSDGSIPEPGNWFLLYHRDETEIRREDSLPVPPLRDDNIWQWRVRVILPPWSIDDETAHVPDVGGDDVDFDVLFA